MKIHHKTIICDPGHAWLAIDHAELDELGITQLISTYSYELKTDNQHLVLLEEDCDMTTYLRHKFDDPDMWRVFARECEEAYDDFDFVRGLPRYQKPEVWMNLVDLKDCDPAPFDQYLLITEAATGRKTAMEIGHWAKLDIERLIKRFVRGAFGGELIASEIDDLPNGDFHASIITDRRDPDSVVAWDSAAFYLKGGEA